MTSGHHFDNCFFLNKQHGITLYISTDHLNQVKRKLKNFMKSDLLLLTHTEQNHDLIQII